MSWQTFKARYRRERVRARAQWPDNWRHSLVLIAVWIPTGLIFWALHLPPIILFALLMVWTGVVMSWPHRKPPSK